jgi:hypothetical protein
MVLMDASPLLPSRLFTTSFSGIPEDPTERDKRAMKMAVRRSPSRKSAFLLV